jgi:hypothetical protein
LFFETTVQTNIPPQKKHVKNTASLSTADVLCSRVQKTPVLFPPFFVFPVVFPMVFPVTQLSECSQERERVVTKGFMEREMRYAQEMREWPDRVAGRTRFLDGDTVKSARTS